MSNKYTKYQFIEENSVIATNVLKNHLLQIGEVQYYEAKVKRQLDIFPGLVIFLLRISL